MPGMRRMIGADAVDQPIVDRPPQRLPVPRVADRRIHLREALEHLIAFGGGQGEVLRRYLNGGDITMLLQQVHLFRRRDVQDVHAPPLARLASVSSRWVAAYAVRASRHSAC